MQAETRCLMVLLYLHTYIKKRRKISFPDISMLFADKHNQVLRIGYTIYVKLT